MNRDEILAKSRKENDLSDERTRYNGLQGANFSISILVLLWVLLSRFTPLDDNTQYAMGLLVSVTCLSNFLYQLVKNRTKTAVFFAVLFFAAAAIYLVLFLKFVLLAS